jgi:HK97 family phage portal protein
MAGGIVVPGDDRIVFSKEQADDLERQFSTRLKGSDKAHRWMVLRFEAKMQALNVSPKDADFVNGMNLTFRQVCRAYGLQSGLQGDAEGNTLANVTAFERLEWSRTLVPDLNLRASEIREQYLPRFKGDPDYCEYDYTQIPALQESASEAWAREAQALDRGAITINEWRKTKGMPPVSWGEKPYMPVNKAPLGDDGQLELPTPPAPSGGAKLPDDEVNPANQPTTPRDFDHHAARRLLATIDWPINGVKR